MKKKKKGLMELASKPIILLIIICLSLAFILSFAYNLKTYARYFMGSILSIFAVIKMLDLKGFKKAFLEYDIVAQKFEQYASYYPLVELVLGIALLSGILLKVFSGITFVIMGLGIAGLIKAIQDEKDLTKPCMQSILKMPLATISLYENIVIGVVALLVTIL